MPQLVAQGGGEGLSESEAAIFHGVVGINFQIAFANEIQIQRRVFGKQREHVVKKRDAGLDPGLAFAIQIQAEGNPGFLGAA